MEPEPQENEQEKLERRADGRRGKPTYTVVYIHEESTPEKVQAAEAKLVAALAALLESS